LDALGDEQESHGLGPLRRIYNRADTSSIL
jgi:hypothetical protein